MFSEKKIVLEVSISNRPIETVLMRVTVYVSIEKYLKLISILV